MVNILLEGYDFGTAWLRDALKPYIRPSHSVAVVAFSFREVRISSPDDWDSFYGRENGKFYKGIAGAFGRYEIKEENIAVLNYFADAPEAAAEKIEQADILYFPGGLPDRLMARMEEFHLRDVLRKHRGVVMGESAGAVIQLAEYHLAPDRDYPTFRYGRGLAYLHDFYLQVHYEGTDAQKAAIRRVLAERQRPVYAPAFQAGAIVVEDQKVKPIGDVQLFTP